MECNRTQEQLHNRPTLWYRLIVGLEQCQAFIYAFINFNVQ